MGLNKRFHVTPDKRKTGTKEIRGTGVVPLCDRYNASSVNRDAPLEASVDAKAWWGKVWAPVEAALV